MQSSVYISSPQACAPAPVPKTSGWLKLLVQLSASCVTQAASEPYDAINAGEQRS
jgi:hypothetical protein